MNQALYLPSGQTIIMDQSAVAAMETLFEMAAQPAQEAEATKLAMCIADTYGQTLVLSSPVWVERFNESLGALLKSVGITLKADGVKRALSSTQWARD